MNVEYKFLTISELKTYFIDSYLDPDRIYETGVELYKNAILSNPNVTDNSYAVCLALVDGKIAGRFMLFRTRLKVSEDVYSIQTGGGLLVAERYRGLGIGASLMHVVIKNDVHLGALFTRAAYNIRKKTEEMLEIPQYVKEKSLGIKKIYDLRINIKLHILKRRFHIERMEIVPNWVTSMINVDKHKYKEVHDASWLQWALDNNATGCKDDYQSFYAVYDRDKNPIGFFMTKVRNVVQGGLQFKKANLVEWDSSNYDNLSEVDINLLAYATLDNSVSRFWTITENKESGNKLKKYFFSRKGWFAMSINKDERFKDIGDVNQWRIRYGCSNTPIVE